MSTDSTLARPATESAELPPRQFVRAVLPWAVAAAALLVYLITLQRWVSLHSLFDLARISGWTWNPDFSSPLYWLVTLPVAWLPARLVPLVLNLLAAVCGALILALLARSVSLLPHDRTRAQRERERGAFYLLSTPTAWLPPLLAVIVCGLQLTFWEGATANLRRMLDLLPLAYVIRCVLEYRIDERESWLTRSSLVFGLGMANHPAMVGFFPAFLVALVWIRGVAFFESRFLLRMFGWGAAGIALYLVLPILHHVTQRVPEFSFWANLKRELVDQKNFLLGLPFNKGRLLNPDNPLILYALYSLLPVLLMGIRWPSTFGDTSATGAKATRTIFHAVHLMFLLACVWIMLDPPVSPRNRGAAFGLPFLSLYYLAALSVGYFSGYVLLVFGQKPSSRYSRSASGSAQLLNYAAVGLVFALLVLAPLILLYRNLPQLRATNGPTVKQYAALLAENIPGSGAFLLSDNPARLLLARAFLVHENKAANHVFVDTGSLRFSMYHRFLKRRYGEGWPVNLPAQTTNAQGWIPDEIILRLVKTLASANKAFYLHPSHGYYFEVLRLVPHGLIYEVEQYQESMSLPPPLAAEQVQQNEDFWRKAKEQALDAVVGLAARPSPADSAGLVQKALARLRLKREPNQQVGFIGALYSQPLVYWGVELQKTVQLQRLQEPEAGKVFTLSESDLATLTNAAAHFETALALNPENLVAQLNIDANRQLQAGRSGAIPSSKEMQEGLGRYRNLLDAMSDNGPFDEANRCYQSGVTFALSYNFRQAKQLLNRAGALDPGNMEPVMALAEIDLAERQYDRVLATVQELRANPKPAAVAFRKRHDTDLLFMEASAHFGLTNDAMAEQVISSALKATPGDEALAGTAAQVYMNNGRLTNALAIAEDYLKQAPDSVQMLRTKSFLCLQLGAFADVIPSSSRIIYLLRETDTNAVASARLNRAIAYFRTDKLDEAKADYEELRDSYTNDFRVYYGLAEIAWRKNDKEAAILNYRSYLTNAPPGTDEAKAVAARLKELESR